MDLKHTPGPWRLTDENRARRVIRGGGEGKPERTVCIIEEWTTEADALLISAAPELAAALLVLEDRREPGRFCDHAAGPCHRCDQAVAALKKAGLRP